MSGEEKPKKIDERTFEFALLVIELYRYLTLDVKEYVMSKQVLRSGTSVGANTHEAQAAQSKKDFIAKMAIASKETRETDYWLRLLDRAAFLQEFQGRDIILKESTELVKILSKIVKTAQNGKRSVQC